MGISKEEISKVKDFLLKKGYPEKFLEEEVVIPFSYNNLNFEVYLPVIVRDSDKVYMIVDYKPQERLHVFERGLIAIGRLFFRKLPYFALVTNLKDFVLVNIPEVKVTKGKEDVVPSWEDLKSFKVFNTKPFKPELEKKILAVYLSGG